METIVASSFSTKIEKIGVNPYVLIPAKILNKLFKQAGRDKGPIPVKGTLNGHAFIQNLVKFSGKWRLYLNTPMRKTARIDVGDTADVKIEFDPKERIILMHPKLKIALTQNEQAKLVFDALRPSRRKEIIRYIGFLKTEESIDRNIKRAMLFLQGKERFIGRDQP